MLNFLINAMGISKSQTSDAKQSRAMFAVRNWSVGHSEQKLQQCAKWTLNEQFIYLISSPHYLYVVDTVDSYVMFNNN